MVDQRLELDQVVPKDYKRFALQVPDAGHVLKRCYDLRDLEANWVEMRTQVQVLAIDYLFMPVAVVMPPILQCCSFPRLELGANLATCCLKSMKSCW